MGRIGRQGHLLWAGGVHQYKPGAGFARQLKNILTLTLNPNPWRLRSTAQY